MLLHEVDKPGSDVEDYVKKLEKSLDYKIDIITKLRTKLVEFHTHLKQEEQLSKQFYEHQNQDDNVDDYLEDIDMQA